MIIESQEGSDALLNDQMERLSLNYHNGTVPIHCPACEVIENNPPPSNFEFDAMQEIYNLLHDRLDFLIS